MGMTLKIAFRQFSLAAALVFFSLALVWLLAPQVLLWIWSVPFSEAVGLLARRAAALFAGIAVMLFLLRDVAPSPARHAVTTGLALACAGLALLGVAEFVAGHAGAGILLAVVVEAALAIGLRLAR